MVTLTTSRRRRPMSGGCARSRSWVASRAMSPIPRCASLRRTSPTCCLHQDPPARRKRSRCSTRTPPRLSRGRPTRTRPPISTASSPARRCRSICRLRDPRDAGCRRPRAPGAASGRDPGRCTCHAAQYGSFGRRGVAEQGLAYEDSSDHQSRRRTALARAGHGNGRRLPDVQVLDLYGPTEATTYSARAQRTRRSRRLSDGRLRTRACMSSTSGWSRLASASSPSSTSAAPASHAGISPTRR